MTCRTACGRKRLRGSRALLFFSLLFASRTALADVVVITPSKDNTLYERADGSRSNGAGQLLFVGRNSQTNESRRRAVLAYDLTAVVPPGAVIDDVTATVHVTQNTNAASMFSLHRIEQDWGEGTSDAGVPGGQGVAAGPGDATWLHRYFDTVMWSVPGGAFVPTVSASATIDGSGVIAWSSSELINDVQDWVNDPAGNFGWIILGDESVAGTAVRIASRESPDDSLRPRLIVTFTPSAAIPAVSTWGMIVLALSLAAWAKAYAFRRWKTTRP